MTDDEETAASYPPDLEAERVPSSSRTEAAGYLQEEIAPPIDGFPQAYGGRFVTSCLVTLTFLAVVYSLYFGRDLIMPLAMAGELNCCCDR